MKYSEFDDIALNQVKPYLHIKSPEILVHVTWLGESYVVKVNETRSLNKNTVKVQKGIKEFLKVICHRGLVPAEMKFFVENNNTYIVVGGASKLNINELAKLAHQYFKDFSKRVVVVEKLGWLPPGGPYQRMEILNALGKLRNCSRKTLRLVMPNFNITLRTYLVGILKDMGVREVFAPGKADLTRMADVGVGDVWVDKVVHQAVIKVNEKGTKAAAATVVVVKEAFPIVDEEVVIDKPFIFMFWDRGSNTILFIGHVVNPTET